MTDRQSTLFPFFTLLSVILLEGFVTIAVEMLTIRQLIPVIGNSVIITSLIIGIFLLFLALGYYRGGTHLDRYRQILVTNFTFAVIFLGFGLSYPFIQLFFLSVFQNVTNNGLIALTIYLLIITAPLTYFLGQTVPITTNLFRSEQHIGSISGTVLCLSTLGSFLGSIVSTLILMNFFGVAWTIVVNCLILVFLILLLGTYQKDIFRLIILVLAIPLIFFFNVAVEQKLFVRTNNYGDYQIAKQVSYPPNLIGNLLYINNAPSSFLTADGKGFNYIELVKRILFQELKLVDKDILVLGAGGFSLSAESTFQNRFLYVDIDKDLPGIAKSGFTNIIRGDFIAEDAQEFLMETKRKFFVVISDVYSSPHTIPFHLLTKEYFESIRRVLLPDGLAIFNIIANPIRPNNYAKRMDNTIRSVFKDCMTIPQPYANKPVNLIYICRARSNPDTTIYTDNLNPSMIDIFYAQD